MFACFVQVTFTWSYLDGPSLGEPKFKRIDPIPGILHLGLG